MSKFSRWYSSMGYQNMSSYGLNALMSRILPYLSGNGKNIINYDLVNAHPSVLLYIVKSIRDYRMNNRPTAYDKVNYLNDKSVDNDAYIQKAEEFMEEMNNDPEFRKKGAEVLGIPFDAYKRCLSAVINGASFSDKTKKQPEGAARKIVSPHVTSSEQMKAIITHFLPMIHVGKMIDEFMRYTTYMHVMTQRNLETLPVKEKCPVTSSGDFYLLGHSTWVDVKSIRNNKDHNNVSILLHSYEQSLMAHVHAHMHKKFGKNFDMLSSMHDGAIAIVDGVKYTREDYLRELNIGCEEAGKTLFGEMYKGGFAMTFKPFTKESTVTTEWYSEVKKDHNSGDATGIRFDHDDDEKVETTASRVNGDTIVDFEEHLDEKMMDAMSDEELHEFIVDAYEDEEIVLYSVEDDLMFTEYDGDFYHDEEEAEEEEMAIKESPKQDKVEEVDDEDFFDFMTRTSKKMKEKVQAKEEAVKRDLINDLGEEGYNAAKKYLF